MPRSPNKTREASRSTEEEKPTACQNGRKEEKGSFTTKILAFGLIDNTPNLPSLTSKCPQQQRPTRRNKAKADDKLLSSLSLLQNNSNNNKKQSTVVDAAAIRRLVKVVVVAAYTVQKQQQLISSRGGLTILEPKQSHTSTRIQTVYIESNRRRRKRNPQSIRRNPLFVVVVKNTPTDTHPPTYKQ